MWELLKKYKENEFAIHFEKRKSLWAYPKSGNWPAWFLRKAFETCSSLVQKKNEKNNNNISLTTGCPINQRPIFGLKEIDWLLKPNLLPSLPDAGAMQSLSLETHILFPNVQMISLGTNDDDVLGTLHNVI